MTAKQREEHAVVDQKFYCLLSVGSGGSVFLGKTTFDATCKSVCTQCKVCVWIERTETL